jgi:histidyl-tRNA synthetase
MPAPQALIVALASNREEECIAASAALRRAGCAAELDLSGRDERGALNYATKRKIPCVVFIGGEKSKKGHARVRRVGSRSDQVVPIASLAPYVTGEIAGTGKAP